MLQPETVKKGRQTADTNFLAVKSDDFAQIARITTFSNTADTFLKTVILAVLLGEIHAAASGAADPRAGPAWPTWVTQRPLGCLPRLPDARQSGSQIAQIDFENFVSAKFDQIPTVKQSEGIVPPSAPPAAGEAAAGPAATLRTLGRCRCSSLGGSAGHQEFLRVLLWPRGREAKTRCRRCEAVSGLDSKVWGQATI